MSVDLGAAPPSGDAESSVPSRSNGELTGAAAGESYVATGDALSPAARPASGGPSAGTAVPPAASFASPSPFPHTPGFLLDVRLTVSVEVGRIHMPVRQVMELGAGSVIELQRNATEPVEIFANGRCIGRGEIVVVGEHFGVRLTELGAPS